MKQKKINIKPCGHYVLVEPDGFEKVTESGIITATDHQARREEVASVKGTLVAAGEIAWADYVGGEPWAKVGDKVWFKRHVSDEIKDEKDIDEQGKPKTYFLLNDNDILAVVG